MNYLEWASSLRRQIHSIDAAQADITKALAQFALKPELRKTGLRDMLAACFDPCDARDHLSEREQSS